MKKPLLLFAIILAVGIAGCKNAPKKDAPAADKEAPAAETKTDCLIGTWGYVENDFEMTFTFNEDKTGQEIYRPDDIRPFTWTYKNGNPVIVYQGQTNEWEFSLDCSTNELKVMGTAYKKK